MMLNALIVDDEAFGLEALQILLRKYCPDITVVAEASSADEAEKKILELRPDLIFLDIEMPFANGFELLQRFKDIFFDVIFTTAYDQYAIKAFKHNAIDYLLKPVDPEELISAVKKCEEKRANGAHAFNRLDALMTSLNQNKTVKKLPVSTLDGIIFVDVDQVVRLAADSNYTNIYLINGKRIVASKTLKEFEEILFPYGFFRSHNTHLINLAFVEAYTKGEGGSLTMADGSNVEVSRNKKNDLLAALSLNTKK
jgi:two-component system LytT family response regulator